MRAATPTESFESRIQRGGLKDLADVQAVIRYLSLKAEFASRLHLHVRPERAELRAAVEADCE